MMDERLDRSLDRVTSAAARMERWTPPAPPSAPAPPPRAAQTEVDEAPTGVIRMRRRAEAVEEASGVKVVRQGGGVPDALIISVPQAQIDVGLATAPDRRLVDKGRHGPLPRIGLDGAKRRRDELANEAEAALAGFGDGARVLVEAARFTAARRS
jgi:hypothetical protein